MPFYLDETGRATREGRRSMNFAPVTLLCVLSTQVQAQVNILTANGGNDRSNANLREAYLSPATVGPATFGKLTTFPVDAQVYAQPLYVSGLSIPGIGEKNVVFLATMHNTVYAYDADAIAPFSVLWQANLGPAVPASLLYGSWGDIAYEVGILGTGVIDLARGVLYVVADTMEGGRPAFYLHALDLATGAERLNGPVRLTASVSGTGSGSRDDGTLPFDPMQHIQRPGLLLANDSVYICFGSHGDMDPYHGWILRHDAADLSRQLGAYASTPTGNGGSFWQSGRGPTADNEGNLYLVSGNGDYDGNRDFGQSFLKMSADITGVLDSFTPADWKSMSENDFDLSAGPALIRGTHTFIGADKGGNLYVVNGDAMNRPDSAAIIPASTGSIFNFAIWARGAEARIYTQGGREPLKYFRVTSDGLDPAPASIAQNTVLFSRIGMTISANGDREGSGILWETTGDYHADSPGTLRAYDASHLEIEVWNSDMNQARDQMPPISKFVSPTVANGKVYVPTASSVVVYGLLEPPANVGQQNALKRRSR
jgi:hypothetical protein